MSTSKWWIVVMAAGSPKGVFSPDERGFEDARKLVASISTDDRPAAAYWARGDFDVAPFAIQQQVTVVAPAIEVKP